jgi:hypothetical protein
MHEAVPPTKIYWEGYPPLLSVMEFSIFNPVIFSTKESLTSIAAYYYLCFTLVVLAVS